MQLIAMITMLIDHVGLLFFPGDVLWRIIGRIAFPIYAYALVQGYQHTSNYRKYASRLLLIAVLSQIPYQLAFDTNGLNVVATLFVSLLVLRMLDSSKPGPLSAIIIAVVCVIMEVLPFDYGAYGLLLVLIFKFANQGKTVAMHLLLNLVYLFAYGWVIQLASILPTLVIAYGPGLWRKLETWRLPRWVWRAFYPAHLVVLAILVYLL
ncbi:conjugal transfer protein TraX [Paenibacillus sp. p3-SID1389]|uniref:conjugal transfer protein TraX n=1 Tax=Paenibacillus sp. p3-SID1389 TaxID=2916364 RepID=UPI0021A5FB3A|nr:conjugal transfer protein TraX [Paenibacillus sp. p3-SID1389]MCT2194109.1 conjugal transfer protein TraX [Paenibacillus sp. p3-SID1389]